MVQNGAGVRALRDFLFVFAINAGAFYELPHLKIKLVTYDGHNCFVFSLFCLRAKRSPLLVNLGSPLHISAEGPCFEHPFLNAIPQESADHSTFGGRLKRGGWQLLCLIIGVLWKRLGVWSGLWMIPSVRSSCDNYMHINPNALLHYPNLCEQKIGGVRCLPVSSGSVMI